MRIQNYRRKTLTTGLGLLIALTLSASSASANDLCSALGLGNTNAIYSALTTALKGQAPNKAANGGLGNHMWGTIVDQDGVVCAVTFTGPVRISQWPGSRVISAQKANTAASFNLPAGLGGTVDALSTANLWTQAQPGGSLFGLQFSNPVDTAAAYGNRGNSDATGTAPIRTPSPVRGWCHRLGGGLACMTPAVRKSSIGVSGDTSCADHNIAEDAPCAGPDRLTTGGARGPSARAGTTSSTIKPADNITRWATARVDSVIPCGSRAGRRAAANPVGPGQGRAESTPRRGGCWSARPCELRSACDRTANGHWLFDPPADLLWTERMLPDGSFHHATRNSPARWMSPSRVRPGMSS